MHTTESLKRDLVNSGIPWDGSVLVHSSMRAIGDVDGRADAVADALVEYFSDGLVVLPTHTWEQAFQDGFVFDPAESASCVGALTNVFWQRPDTIRSLHPTHSVAAAGADASWLTRDDHLWGTPCSREGVYGKLMDRGAYILFVGCPMTKNTFVHGVEEWKDIPNRLSDQPTRFLIQLPDGSLLPNLQRRHQAPIDDISGNYDKLEAPLEKLGLLVRFQFGDAEVLAVKARDVERLTTRFLEFDPDLFLTPDPIPVDWYPTSAEELVRDQEQFEV